MTKKLILITTLLLLVACQKKDHDHHHGHHEHHDKTNSPHLHHGHTHETSSDNLHAHVHGELTLALIAEGNTLYFQLSGASDSLLGFERPPTTPEEKRLWAQLSKAWEGPELAQFFIFSENTPCQRVESSLELITSGGHANISIEGEVKCPFELHGQELHLQKIFAHYPRLKTLQVEVLPEKNSPARHRLRSTDTNQRVSL